MPRPFDYYFGVSDARRHGRRVALGVGVALAGVLVGTFAGTPPAFAAGLVAVFAGLWYARPAFRRLFVPAPWQAGAWKYAPLRHALDLEGADRWLDVGSGTGRSPVGLATAAADAGGSTPDGPGRPGGARTAALAGVGVTAVDAFGRTLAGDAALLAERNAAAAGLDATAVRGAVDRLPVRDGSQDVVTTCCALGHLPAGRRERALREARRVVHDGGGVGVLEPAESRRGSDDPLDGWAATVEEAGFEVVASGAVRRRGSGYVYLVAAPA